MTAPVIAALALAWIATLVFVLCAFKVGGDADAREALAQDSNQEASADHHFASVGNMVPITSEEAVTRALVRAVLDLNPINHAASHSHAPNGRK